MRLPTFLVIGAQRSGTTTLHYTLGQHPQIFVSPIKETNFFLHDEAGALPAWVDPATRERTPRSLDEYARLFAQAGEGHLAIGESSPGYLHGPVAGRIKARLPAARLVAMLRHPVEQALSIYATWHGGSLPGDRPIERFAEALASGAPGPDGALPLARHGLYHQHLAPFYHEFAPEQIEVTLFDDLQRDGATLFANLFRFLGVDPGFQLAEVARFNGTGEARSATLQRLLAAPGLKRLARATLPEGALARLNRLYHRVRSANLRQASVLSPALRRELTARFYGDDIERLAGLTGRDLSPWLA